jgi:hypothetical protein
MSRPSEAQVAANRHNSKHSSGPKSEHGKHRSSQNAMRHGLSGRIVVLPHEDMEVFKAFSKEIVESLNANSPMERQCAQAIADAQWRLNRARTFEDGMIAMWHFEAEGNFTADSPEIHAALTAAKVFRDRSKDFANLALYEQRIGKAQKEAFRQLYDLQARRQTAAAMQPTLEEPKPVPNAAIASAAAAATTKPAQSIASGAEIPNGQDLSPQMPDCKPNAVAIGFVYSTTEINPAPSEKNTGIAPVTPLPIPEKQAAWPLADATARPYPRFSSAADWNLWSGLIK